MKNEICADNQHITKKEMAVRMQVTPRTIDAWMQKGLIPYRKIGRTVRFCWGEVSEHFASQQRRAQYLTSAAPVTGKNLIWGENTGLLRYFPESSAA